MGLSESTQPHNNKTTLHTGAHHSKPQMSWSSCRMLFIDEDYSQNVLDSHMFLLTYIEIDCHLYVPLWGCCFDSGVGIQHPQILTTTLNSTGCSWDESHLLNHLWGICTNTCIKNSSVKLYMPSDIDWRTHETMMPGHKLKHGASRLKSG